MPYALSLYWHTSRTKHIPADTDDADTDASDSEVRGVLGQEQDGCEWVICYGSK